VAHDRCDPVIGKNDLEVFSIADAMTLEQFAIVPGSRPSESSQCNGGRPGNKKSHQGVVTGLPRWGVLPP
jgi:hypothetical protein